MSQLYTLDALTTYNSRLSTRSLTATLTSSILVFVHKVPDSSYSLSISGAFAWISSLNSPKPLSPSLLSSLVRLGWGLGRGAGWSKQNKQKQKCMRHQCSLISPLKHLQCYIRQQDCTIVKKYVKCYALILKQISVKAFLSHNLTVHITSICASASAEPDWKNMWNLSNSLMSVF